MALKIEKFISGAYGLAHNERGEAVLVKSALPGEVIEQERVVRKANVLVVEKYSILEKSDKRIDPKCPHYGICGGCDFLIVSEKESAKLKEESIKENLMRIGKLSCLPPFSEPSYSSFNGYRSRCRFHVDLKKKEVGFLRRNSNELFSISSCPALTERINKLLLSKDEIIRDAQRRMLLGEKNRATSFIEVPVLDGDDEISLADKNIKALGYDVNSSCFFQSNLRLLPSLLSFVKESAKGSVIADLYSGVGTFSRLFEGEGKKVYAIEKNPKCLPLSKKNAPSAISFTDDAASFSKRIKDKIDTLIVDPPRLGLSDEVIRLINEMHPVNIIYVSCDSTTLSRDIARLDAYEIEKARVFDFYPGSFHEECALSLKLK